MWLLSISALSVLVSLGGYGLFFYNGESVMCNKKFLPLVLRPPPFRLLAVFMDRLCAIASVTLNHDLELGNKVSDCFGRYLIEPKVAHCNISSCPF